MKSSFSRLIAPSESQLARLRGSGGSEVLLLVAALVVLLFGYGFIELADHVKKGKTQTIDEWVLRSLRRSDDPAVPIGPEWLRDASLDITALGSPVVLFLVVIAVIGFMRLQRQYGAILLTGVATVSGRFAMVFLKDLIERDRPAVVPHLRIVTEHSFPSGHAMLSAIVYFTLGILLMQIVAGRAAKLYCLIWAMSLTFLVGVSRIYLGVHYPTDVLAGWMAGIAWALGWWVVAQYFRGRFTFFEFQRQGARNP